MAEPGLRTWAVALSTLGGVFIVLGGAAMLVMMPMMSMMMGGSTTNLPMVLLSG